MGRGAIIWKRGVNSREVSGEQSQNEKFAFEENADYEYGRTVFLH